MKKQFKVYGTGGCRFCSKATSLLEEKGYAYDYININNDEQAKSFIVNDMGLRTVPQIFFNGDRIGGYDDLALFFLNRGIESK